MLQQKHLITVTEFYVSISKSEALILDPTDTLRKPPEINTLGSFDEENRSRDGVVQFCPVHSCVVLRNWFVKRGTIVIVPAKMPRISQQCGS